MAGKELKTWQKVALGVVTVGVTATAVYFGIKGFRKMIAAKKKAPAPAADKQVAEKTEDKK